MNEHDRGGPLTAPADNGTPGREVRTQSGIRPSVDVRSARAMLIEERRRVLELLEAMPGGYVETDAYGKILTVNQATSEILNVPESRLRGKRLINYVVSANGRRDFQLSLMRLRRGAVLNEARVFLRPRRGAPVVEVAVSATAKTDAAGAAMTAHWLLRPLSTSETSNLPPIDDDGDKDECDAIDESAVSEGDVASNEMPFSDDAAQA